MSLLVDLAVLWILLAVLLTTCLIAMELTLDGESSIRNDLKSIPQALLRIVLLRPLVSPSRAMLLGFCLSIGMVFLGVAIGTSAKAWLESPGSSDVLLVSQQRTAVQWLAPLLTAPLALWVMIGAVERRGIEQLETIGRKFARSAFLLVGVSATVTVASPSPILAAVAAITYSQVINLPLFLVKIREKYLARVAYDRDFLTLREQQVWILWRLAQAGLVPLSYLIARATIRKPNSKDSFKLKAVLAYHVHRYRESYDLASRGIEYCRSLAQSTTSEILVSYRCLAAARSGALSQAIRDLRDALNKNPANYYYRSNLSYLLWIDDHVDEAIAEASRALAEYSEKKGHPCVQTATFLSLFFCERELDRRAAGMSIAEDSLGRSLSLAAHAYRQMRPDGSSQFGEGLGALVHNLGLACVLLSDLGSSTDRDELCSFAFDAFARSVWRESHAGSRFRLALLHMVGTRGYHSAEYQLQRILWPLTNQPHRRTTRFGRLVQLNLERVRKARSTGVVFGPGILVLHTARDLIPESAAIAKGDLEEVRAYRNRWLTLELGRILRDPLEEKLPPMAAEARSKAPARPWLAPSH